MPPQFNDIDTLRKTVKEFCTVRSPIVDDTESCPCYTNRDSPQGRQLQLNTASGSETQAVDDMYVSAHAAALSSNM